MALVFSIGEHDSIGWIWLSMNNIAHFGSKLHNLRKRQRLTLRQLAIALNYRGYGYLSEVETGKKSPTADLILRVSRYFEVSTDILMRDELDLPTEDPLVDYAAISGDQLVNDN